MGSKAVLALGLDRDDDEIAEIDALEHQFHVFARVTVENLLAQIAEEPRGIFEQFDRILAIEPAQRHAQRAARRAPHRVPDRFRLLRSFEYPLVPERPALLKVRTGRSQSVDDGQQVVTPTPSSNVGFHLIYPDR